MSAAELQADAAAALARLTEEEGRLVKEEGRLSVALGETEAQLRGIRRRLAAIAGERDAWAARAARARCPGDPS